VAIDVFREDEKRRSSNAAEHAAQVSHLEAVLADVAEKEKMQDPDDRGPNIIGPQALLEALYEQGFARSVQTSAEQRGAVNVLRLAKDLLRLR